MQALYGLGGTRSLSSNYMVISCPDPQVRLPKVIMSYYYKHFSCPNAFSEPEFELISQVPGLSVKFRMRC